MAMLFDGGAEDRVRGSLVEVIKSIYLGQLLGIGCRADTVSVDITDCLRASEGEMLRRNADDRAEPLMESLRAERLDAADKG